MGVGQKSFHDGEKKVVLKECFLYIETNYHFQVVDCRLTVACHLLNFFTVFLKVKFIIKLKVL